LTTLHGWADYYNDYTFLLITDDQTYWDRGDSRYHLRVTDIHHCTADWFVEDDIGHHAYYYKQIDPIVTGLLLQQQRYKTTTAQDYNTLVAHNAT
jgi:hypothetical protein